MDLPVVAAASVELALRSSNADCSCDLAVWCPSNAQTLRLHCRLTEIHSITIDKKPTKFTLRDPLPRPQPKSLQRHETDAYETWLRAATIAASVGELEVSLPTSTAPQEQDDFVSSAAARAKPPGDMRLVRLRFEYTLSGEGGVAFTEDGGLHTLGGASLLAPDVDGARCWVPCVDDGSRCAWRLRIGVPGGQYLVAATGAKSRQYEAKGLKWHESTEAWATPRGVGIAVVRDQGQCRRVVGCPSKKSAAPLSLTTRVESVVESARKFLTTVECAADCGAARLDTLTRELADAAHFWHAYFCSSDEEEEHHHWVVQVGSLRRSAISFVGLTLVRESFFAEETAQRELVVEALYGSLAMSIEVKTPEADEWLLHAVKGYVSMKFFARKKNNNASSLLVRMHNLAIKTTTPLSRGFDDEEAVLEEERWEPADESRAVFVMHKLELLIGGSRNVREGLRRLHASLKEQHKWSTSAFLRTLATFSPDPLNVAEFRRRWIDASENSFFEASYTYNAKRHSVELELTQTGSTIFVGEISVRVVEADDAWDYTKKLEHRTHKWEFKCHSRFTKVVKEVEAPISAKVGGVKDREVDLREQQQTEENHVPVERVKRWRADRHAESKKDKSSPFSTEGTTPTTTKEAPGDTKKKETVPPTTKVAPAAAAASRAVARAEEDFGSVSREARRENGTPILWLKIDPQLALPRSLNMTQRDAAWVEQLFGDDEEAAQMQACRALGAQPSLLGAKALATCLRATLGAAHSTGVRCAAAKALVQLQTKDATTKGLRASWHATTQLVKAFDERFRDDETLRPFSFDSQGASHLELKCALVEAFGGLLEGCSEHGLPTEISERVVELLRDHYSTHQLSDAPYLVKVLKAVSLIKKNTPLAAEAREQARRYLEWNVMTRELKDRDAELIGAAALKAVAALRPDAEEVIEDEDDELYFAPQPKEKQEDCSLETTSTSKTLRAAALGSLSSLNLVAALRRPEAAGYLRDSIIDKLRGCSDEQDAIWDALLDPRLAFDQPARLALLRLHRETARRSSSTETELLPETLEPLRACVVRRRAREEAALAKPAPSIKKIRFGFGISRAPSPPPGGGGGTTPPLLAIAEAASSAMAQ